MTKKLQEFFNLPDPPAPEQPAEQIEEQKRELTYANDIISRIDQALPQVHDLDDADREMDELADLAKDKFNDLMDLGMNVEARFSGTILQTAGVLLGHAITAKQAKIDKKLRMVELQLKKMRLDQIENKDGSSGAIDGHAIVLDRNALLKQIIGETKASKKDN